MTSSDVFQKMLSSNTLEAKTGVLQIKDTHSSTIEALIDYLYLKEITNMSEIGDELYVFADKYFIGDLKVIFFTWSFLCF